jgi:hypothetical protein
MRASSVAAAYDARVKSMIMNAHLLKDRPRPVQILLGGVIPAIVGVIAGVLVNESLAAYYAVGIVAGLGAFLSGFEHRDGWGGADRGFFGGLIYGTALLITNQLMGDTPKTSLGSFKPLFAVLTAIIGMLIAAAGGRLARATRERNGIFLTDPPEA